MSTAAGAGVATTTTAGQILHQITTYFSTVISTPPLRRHLISTFLKNTPPCDEIFLKTINIASQTLEHALSTTKPSLKSSSLRLAESLLLPYPNNPFSSFLLSLLYHLSDRQTEATINLLEVFYHTPSLARMEVSPYVFQELFLAHFYPVYEWYNDERLKISGSRRLSNMSGDQALELKCLARDFERLLDENTRNFVGYFKEVLRDKETGEFFNPPNIILENHERYDECECEGGD